MNIFSKSDYRDIVREVIEQRKKTNPNINFQQMASHCRIAKSYLSKVLHKRADIDSDQLFLICEYLDFDLKERNYMFLLLEFARCSLKKRKDLLLTEIESIQNQHLDTKNHIKIPVADDKQMIDYYLDPMNQIIHMALTIPRFLKDTNSIITILNITPQRLLNSLRTLEKLKIIRQNKHEIKVLQEKLHLSREAPVYRAWRTQLKLLAMLKSDSVPDEEGYNFSVIFTADLATRKKIQSLFLVFLKEVESLVHKSEKASIFQMSFELFPWG